LSEKVSIRPAAPSDAVLIASLIYDLACYEKAPEKCEATPERVAKQLFSECPAAECLIAEVDGEPAAFAVFFPNFSTWLSRPGMHLEDLYVKPEYRRLGIGKALLKRLAQICVERDYGRFEWSCLEWNELAKSQYRKIGAEPMDEWRTWRLDGDAIGKLADG